MTVCCLGLSLPTWEEWIPSAFERYFFIDPYQLQRKMILLFVLPGRGATCSACIRSTDGTQKRNMYSVFPLPSCNPLRIFKCRYRKLWSSTISSNCVVPAVFLGNDVKTTSQSFSIQHILGNISQNPGFQRTTNNIQIYSLSIYILNYVYIHVYISFKSKGIYRNSWKETAPWIRFGYNQQIWLTFLLSHEPSDQNLCWFLNNGVWIYIKTNTHMYIYIYIHTMCMHIHVYVHMWLYIYTWIYMNIS